MPDFRKDALAPAASGLPDAVFFVRTVIGKFDLYVADDSGNRTTLDRVPVMVTSGPSPHASPRYGDKWHDTATDHIFEWSLVNGGASYWLDVS
jgi:hypothetical protein